MIMIFLSLSPLELTVHFLCLSLSVCLSVSLSSRYAHGPVPLQSHQYTTTQDIITAVNCIQHEMVFYKPSLTQVPSLPFFLALESDYKKFIENNLKEYKSREVNYYVLHQTF